MMNTKPNEMDRGRQNEADKCESNDISCDQRGHESTHTASKSSWVIRLNKATTRLIFGEPISANAETQTDNNGDLLQASLQSSDNVNGVHCNVTTENVKSDSSNKMPCVHDAGTMTERLENNLDSSSHMIRKDIQKPSIPLLHRGLSTPRAFNVGDGTENHVDCCISGIAVIDDRKIVVADINQSKLKLLNEKLQLKSCIKTEGQPVAMCRILNNKIAVVIATRRINIYNVDESITFFRGFNLRHYCRSVCETANGEIALLLSNIDMIKSGNTNMDSDNNIIYIEFRDPLDGRVLREIGNFRYNVKSPTCIVQDTIGRIVVGEITLVSAVNDKGVNDWYYISHTKAKLKRVSGLAVDQEGNMYICGNESNNVHQVSCRNYKKNRVIVPFISSPRSVAYDAFQSRVIVGCDNSACLYVYPFV